MKNSSIVYLHTGEDSKYVRQLQRIVEANLYIQEHELRSQFSSSIELPTHIESVVKEKLGITKARHKFNSYDPYTEEGDVEVHAINYHCDSEQHS